MVVIDKTMIEENQDYINYMNADCMFFALEKFIDTYGKDAILERDHDTKEKCLSSYVLRSNVARLACDACEHYAKAMLISNGMTWEDTKSLGHNLLRLFNTLDDESRNTIMVSLMQLNNFDALNDTSYNSYDILSDMFLKYHLIRESLKLDDEMDLAKDNFNLAREVTTVNSNDIKKEKFPYIHDENITPLDDDQTVESELEKLNPSHRNQPLFTIKSRFPGQYLVDENTEFLISLAYTFNKLSKFQRDIKNNFK